MMSEVGSFVKLHHFDWRSKHACRSPSLPLMESTGSWMPETTMEVHLSTSQACVWEATDLLWQVYQCLLRRLLNWSRHAASTSVLSNNDSDCTKLRLHQLMVHIMKFPHPQACSQEERAFTHSICMPDENSCFQRENVISFLASTTPAIALILTTK